jgi:hypothetical protein
LPITSRTEFFQIVVEGGNLLEAGDVVGMLVENLHEAVDGHLGSLLVVGSIEAWHDLLRVGSREVEPGHGVGGIEVDSFLEVIDGLFVFRLLVGLHSLVELIARLEAFTAGRGSHQEDCGSGQHHWTCYTVHSVYLLLQLAREPKSHALRGCRERLYLFRGPRQEYRSAPGTASGKLLPIIGRPRSWV